MVNQHCRRNHFHARSFCDDERQQQEKTQAKLDLLRADQATLILHISKLEKRVDDRDTRTDVIKEGQYSMLRTLDALSM